MLFIALKGTPTVPLVRVPWNDFVFIKRVLDSGAAGILIPHIKTATDATCVRLCLARTLTRLDPRG